MEHTWKNISSVLGVSEYQHILGVQDVLVLEMLPPAGNVPTLG